MDALWHVADRVMTESEINALSLGEAFLLTVGFYLHDIGMAMAANAEGIAKVRDSAPYKEFISRASSMTVKAIDAQAVAYAVRKLHAQAATSLATSLQYPVPTNFL
jgi:hypothetical protein